MLGIVNGDVEEGLGHQEISLQLLQTCSQSMHTQIATKAKQCKPQKAIRDAKNYAMGICEAEGEVDTDGAEDILG